MKRRSGIQIMGKLIGLIRPLMHVMAAAILLGVTGYLCAIFLTVLAGVGILQIMGIWQGASLTTLFVCLGSDRSTAWNSALWRAGMQSLYCV